MMTEINTTSGPEGAAGGFTGGDSGGGDVGGEGGGKGGGDVGGGEGGGGSGGGGEGAREIKTARATVGVTVMASPVAALTCTALLLASFISTRGRSVMDDTVESHLIVAVMTTEPELTARVTREVLMSARVARLLAKFVW